MKFAEQVAAAYRKTGVKPIRETYYDKGAMCGLTAWLCAGYGYVPQSAYGAGEAVAARFTNDLARAAFVSGFDGEEAPPYVYKRACVVWHAIGREAARLMFGEEGGK